jgi:hypothetical protein
LKGEMPVVWLLYSKYKIKKILLFLLKLLVMGIYYKFKKDEKKYQPPFEE